MIFQPPLPIRIFQILSVSSYFVQLALFLSALMSIDIFTNTPVNHSAHIPFHATCPKCHHWQNQYDVSLEEVLYHQVDIKCERCPYQFCRLGGMSPASTLLSEETIKSISRRATEIFANNSIRAQHSQSFSNIDLITISREQHQSTPHQQLATNAETPIPEPPTQGNNSAPAATTENDLNVAESFPTRAKRLHGQIIQRARRFTQAISLHRPFKRTLTNGSENSEIETDVRPSTMPSTPGLLQSATPEDNARYAQIRKARSVAAEAGRRQNADSTNVRSCPCRPNCACHPNYGPRHNILRDNTNPLDRAVNNAETRNNEVLSLHIQRLFNQARRHSHGNRPHLQLFNSSRITLADDAESLAQTLVNDNDTDQLQRSESLSLSNIGDGMNQNTLLTLIGSGFQQLPLLEELHPSH